MVDISIASYNVKGLGNELKRRKIFNYLHEKKFDIVLMQETHATGTQEKFWASEWGGKILYANGTSAARWTAILIRKKLENEIKEIHCDPDGRFLIVVISINDIDFVITNIYAPNFDNPDFFANVFTKTENLCGRKIIAGDFNTILDPKLDIKGGKGYSHLNSTKFINEYFEQNEMADIWRLQNPD